MTLLLTALRTCPRFLNWLLPISLGLLFLKVTVLDTIPALFPKAYDIGQMVNNILIANIAGYIFYLLSAEIPRVIQKRNSGKEVIAWAERVAHNIIGFLQMLHNTNMPHHPTDPNLLDIESVNEDKVRQEFTLVSPTALAPMSNGYLNGNIAPQLSWLGAIATHDEWSKRDLEKIWKRYPFFDSELSTHLIKIESSIHSHQMKELRDFTLPFIQNGGIFQNTDLSTWAKHYYLQYENARQLIRYCKEFKFLYSIS
jgi:hypothetical protein